jgi:predicted PurR-regulated permease PerM
MNTKKGTVVSWKTCCRIVVCVFAVFLLIRYWGSIEGFVGTLLSGIAAIIAGLVIAYVGNIPLRFFERILPGDTGDGTLNRLLALSLTVVCAVAVLLFVGFLVIPQLVNAIVTLVKDAPAIVNTITSIPFVRNLIPESMLAQNATIDWGKVVGDAAQWAKSGVMSSLPQITSFVGLVGACLMGFVFAFWFLSEKTDLSARVHRIIRAYVGADADDFFKRTAALADDCFHGYIVGQSMEALIFGGLVALVSLLFGLENPLMLGALVGVMSLIPMVGALIGAILGALIISVTSWQQAVIFLVLFFVVQQIEANFIYIRVVGRHVGLNGMWPLIGVTLGATLFGFAGAYVGVPLISAIFRTIEADLARRDQLPEKATPVEKLKDSLSD